MLFKNRPIPTAGACPLKMPETIMHYQINEGTFTVAVGALDRSLNMLVLNYGPGGLTLVVSRDQRQEGEDLDGLLERQVRTLAAQVKNFKVLQRRQVLVGTTHMPGLQMSTSFRQNNAGIHQQLTVFNTGHDAVLIFTLTCASPLTAEQQAYCAQLLDSFTPPSPPSA